MHLEEVRQDAVPAADAVPAVPKPGQAWGLRRCCGLHHPAIPR